MSRLESSPSTLGRWAPGIDALRPEAAGFTLPVSIAPHLALWRLIAEGSSLVFEGFDRHMGARVAVKVLAARGDANAHARLFREAALYANLDSRSVPRLYDVAALADGTPYVVMEFVAGQTLAELLARGPLAPSVACDIANQVLESLVVLHGAGIVHRDIKPTNIILEPTEGSRHRVRVVDLGVAKAEAFDIAPDKLTQPGSLVGTPQYMAPEQFAGADADARSDLYAVGLTFVEMLTGRCPHAATSFADLVAARMRDELDVAALARAGIGPGLTRFLRTALARDPGARFSSAADMQCELHAARADESCLWMQRLPREPRAPSDAIQPVAPVATLPPAVRAPNVAVDSAVWGVLPDPPPFDELRRPPNRSGVKALLLGFGLTLAAGTALVLRAQMRDTAEAASAAEAESESAQPAPLANAGPGDAPEVVPASAAGAIEPVSAARVGSQETPIGSAARPAAGVVPSLTQGRESARGVAAALPQAARPRGRASSTRHRVERSRRVSAEREAPEKAPSSKVSDPLGLPENPY